MRKNPKLSLLVAAVAVLALAAIPTHALTAPAGSDIFTTPAGGQTTVNLSLFPIAAAFGGNATASPTLVALKGKAISGLGSTDTVVQRFNNVILNGVGDSGTTAIELVGLRLVSENPIAITVGNTTTAWNLEVGLSPSASSLGTMTIQQNTSGGGTFDADFNVFPRLRFSASGQADVVIDCGQVACGTMTLSTSNAAWASSSAGFNPGTAGVPGIGNGTSFDGDGDGVADDTYTRSTFYPGFDPVSHQAVQLSHDHPPVAEHTQRPNTQCKRRTVTPAEEEEEPVFEHEQDRETGTGTTTNAATGVTAVSALCAAVAEPTPVDPVSLD